MGNQLARLEALMQSRQVWRRRDLAAAGISQDCLRRAAERNFIERGGRGVYVSRLAADNTEEIFGWMAARAPRAVFCLSSAAVAHGLLPSSGAIDLALPRGAWKPTQPFPVEVRFVFVDRRVFDEDVEVHTIRNDEFRVYSPERTVIDLFKYERVQGRDVAVRALSGYLDLAGARLHALWEVAGRIPANRNLRKSLESALRQL